MTVSQIRDLMLERVVPESLLPQNIAACLIDEGAALSGHRLGGFSLPAERLRRS